MKQSRLELGDVRGGKVNGRRRGLQRSLCSSSFVRSREIMAI